MEFATGLAGQDRPKVLCLGCAKAKLTQIRHASVRSKGLHGRLSQISCIRLPRRRKASFAARVFPFDVAWDVDSQELASNLFATSIFPYAGFLYHLQKSKKAPKLTMFGFYFLLVFVLATIIAGVYAKLHYNSILANIDWLHGSAESFLTLTNLFIVLGLRKGILEAENASQQGEQELPDVTNQEKQ